MRTKQNASPVTGGNQRSTRVACWMVCTILLAMWLVPTRTALAGGLKQHGGKRDVEVMTVNLYVGGDIGRVVGLDPSDPNYPSNLVVAVTGVYYEILASDPAARLQGVAGTIAAQMPDLVGVQEASLLRNQSPGDLMVGGTQPATNVVLDYLQILIDALAARGAHYAVAASTDEIDVEMPALNLSSGGIDDVRLTDRDAILVRTDLPRGHLRVWNPRGDNFATAITIPGIGLVVPRGWCSVDVFSRGQIFSFVCTHLEEETAPVIQQAQADELVAGLAKVRWPVILVGDLNTDPLHRNGTTSYDTFAHAGFKDAWSSVHPMDLAGGLTWGHDEFLADPTLAFIWRIDLVLYRGRALAPADADVLDLRLNGTQPPLWSSDHAAVAVEFAPGHLKPLFAR